MEGLMYTAGGGGRGRLLDIYTGSTLTSSLLLALNFIPHRPLTDMTNSSVKQEPAIYIRGVFFFSIEKLCHIFSFSTSKGTGVFVGIKIKLF